MSEDCRSRSAAARASEDGACHSVRSATSINAWAPTRSTRQHRLDRGVSRLSIVHAHLWRPRRRRPGPPIPVLAGIGRVVGPDTTRTPTRTASPPGSARGSALPTPAAPGQRAERPGCGSGDVVPVHHRTRPEDVWLASSREASSRGANSREEGPHREAATGPPVAGRALTCDQAIQDRATAPCQVSARISARAAAASVGC